MKIKKYAIYARTSGDVEIQNLSIKHQVKTLQIFAGKNHLNVTRIYEEIGSARAKERPAFESMIQSIKKGQVNGILCVGVDRLTRSFETSAELKNLIERKRLDIVTPTISIFNTDVAFISLLLPCLFERANYEVMSRRIKEGIAKKKAVVYARVSSEIQESEEGGE